MSRRSLGKLTATSRREKYDDEKSLNGAKKKKNSSRRKRRKNMTCAKIKSLSSADDFVIGLNSERENFVAERGVYSCIY